MYLNSVPIPFLLPFSLASYAFPHVTLTRRSIHRNSVNSPPVPKPSIRYTSNPKHGIPLHSSISLHTSLPSLLHSYSHLFLLPSRNCPRRLRTRPRAQSLCEQTNLCQKPCPLRLLFPPLLRTGRTHPI